MNPSISHLFNNLDVLISQIPGWCTTLKAQMLAASVITLRPDVSLILGVFGGRDTFALALAHREIGKGKVYAVDPWSANCSIQGQGNPADHDWWSKTDHEKIYLEYLNKVEVLQLGGIIETHRMQSDYFPVPERIDLAIIDANHGPQAEIDVSRFAPSVRIGGLVLLDDLNWHGGFVTNAAHYLLRTGFTQLYRIDDGAVFQRTDQCHVKTATTPTI